MYELCTSDGISGPIRHFRPLKSLQVTDSALVKVIVVRIHAGEPHFCFNSLELLERFWGQDLYARKILMRATH